MAKEKKKGKQLPFLSKSWAVKNCPAMFFSVAKFLLKMQRNWAKELTF